MTGVIRIGTWNIHEVIAEAGEERARREVLEQVDRAALDVLLLQEVPFTTGGRSALLALLTERTGLPFASGTVLSHSVRHPALRSGVAVLTRQPQSAHSHVRLPNPRLHARYLGREITSWDKGVHFARLDHGGISVSVASVHSYPFHIFDRDPAEPAFDPVWRALAASLDRLSTPPALIGGDFNAEDRDLLFRFIAHRRLNSANKGIATHNGHAVDDIVHDMDMTLREFSVVTGFSDHALCLAEFEIERSAK